MAPDAERAERARAFENGAHAYRVARPTYPDDAVRWAVPAGARDVLDLAAGTGKLTERLVALDLDVTAVEPSRAMRQELQSWLPEVEPLAGSAEHTGLPDASFDLVTVAQAWHWFDAAAASAEIARVLRPGGTLSVLWNVRDDDVDWVAEFTRIVHRHDAHPVTGERATGPELSAAFGPLEHQQVRWVDEVRAESLRPLAASHSSVLVLAPAAQEAVLHDVDVLVRTHPELRGRAEIAVPYVTDCWRAVTV